MKKQLSLRLSIDKDDELRKLIRNYIQIEIQNNIRSEIADIMNHELARKLDDEKLMKIFNENVHKQLEIYVNYRHYILECAEAMFKNHENKINEIIDYKIEQMVTEKLDKKLKEEVKKIVVSTLRTL